MGDKMFQRGVRDHEQTELGGPINASPGCSPVSSPGLANPLSCIRLFPSYASEESSPSNQAHRTDSRKPGLANMVADLEAEFWAHHGDASEWLIPGPGIGGVIAAGGRTAMGEIAKRIVGLLSESKTISQTVAELAQTLEQAASRAEALRREIAEAITLRGKPQRMAAMKAEEAALAQQIAKDTDTLFKGITASLAKKEIAPQTFQQLVRDIGDLRSHLPRQQPK